MTLPRAIAADDFDIGEVSRTQKSVPSESTFCSIVICSQTDLREVISDNALEITRLVVIRPNVRRRHDDHRRSDIIGLCEVGGCEG